MRQADCPRGGPNLAALHPELLEHILLYLRPSDVYTCLFVCKRITQIARHRPLHRHISLTYSASCVETLKYFIRHPHVRSLVRRIDTDEALIEDEDKATYQLALIELLPALHTLDGLILSEEPTVTEGIIDAVKHHQKMLQHIRFPGPTHVPTKSLQMLLDVVRPVSLWLQFIGWVDNLALGRHLQQLRLAHMIFAQQEVLNVLRNLPGTLSVLQFDSCGLQVDLIANIAKFCPQLQFLAVTECYLDASQDSSIEAEVLRPFKSLRRFAISSPFIIPLALVYLSCPLELVYLEGVDKLNVGWLALAFGHWQIAEGGLKLMVAYDEDDAFATGQELDALYVQMFPVLYATVLMYLSQDLCVNRSVQLLCVPRGEFPHYQSSFEFYD